MSDPLLEIKNLVTGFETESGLLKAVDGVSFTVPKGTCVGIVGESGCGKSVTAMSIVRLLLPGVLLPATTALGTLLPGGREQGILHGANVVMPNLSPEDAREKYTLYDNKLHSGAEAAESLNLLRQSLGKIGYEVAVSRGDSKAV